MTGQDGYLLWLVGAAVLIFTLVQAARTAEPMKFPRPSAAALSTALAWLLIAALVVAVAVTRR